MSDLGCCRRSMRYKTGDTLVVVDKCTDISNITRKPSNTDTRNGRAQEKPKIQSQSQKKSSLNFSFWKGIQKWKDPWIILELIHLNKLELVAVSIKLLITEPFIEEFLTLVSRAHLTNEEFEASELSDTRITSSYSTALSDSTTLLSPNHPLTKTIPTHMLSRPLYYHRTARIAIYILLRKRYRGTSELILDTETEDDESEAEGTGSRSEESEDEGPNSEVEEAALEGQQQKATLVKVTTTD
ncbi:hypothetical protein Tco_0545399 [Tanacetum coccineum]